jgi:iron complex outermembrane receptor protein
MLRDLSPPREEANVSHHRARSLCVSTSLLGLAAGVAGPALAQQTPPASRANQNTVQEIVVTAQRQSQSLLSVPLSISAATGTQLQKAGIQDLTALQFTTPGYVPQTSSGYTQLYIRGIGNSIFVGADPSVATFIDDVPRIYGSMVQNFINVDRVEVLKGAQGGLYGRNATGGVVNIITKQPTTDGFHADARVSYGERNTVRAAADVNLPISDMAALTLAFDREVHDPYVKNIAGTNPYTAAMFPFGSFFGGPAETAVLLNSHINPPHGLYDGDFWAFESKLLVKPVDNFKITFAADYSQKRDSDGTQIFAGDPGYLQGFSTIFLSSFVPPQPGLPAGSPLVRLPAGFVKGNDGKYTAERGIPVFTWLTDYGASATAVWSLPHVDLTSITAYRAQQTDFFEDLAAGPAPLIDVLVQNRKWFFYQELRAVSNDTGRLHYLAGATYLRDDFHGRSHTDYLAMITNPATHVVDEVKNWSIYGQIGYDILEALNLTVSGRYVHETNTADFTDPVAQASTASLEEHKFLPSATLSYKLDGGGNIYARFAEGFKAGGINPIAPPIVFPDPTQGSQFKPETVKTYEIGYRAPLFDHRVQVTAAAFYNDYKNLQVSAHSTPAHPEVFLAIVNAGSARTYGAEGSITWRVNQAVTLGANAGYLDAKYDTFAVNDPTGILANFNQDGQVMPNSPKWQLSFTGDLDQPISDQYRLVGTLLVSHLSSMVFLQSNLPGVLPEPGQPGYWLANARLGVRTANDNYGVAIFANNLFNKGYLTYGSSSSLGNQLTWGTPRVAGVEVTAKF